MNNESAQPSLILTQRRADGTVEWIPLAGPDSVPTVAGGAYALIARADYEAPQTLVAHRQGDDLVLEVQAAEVLVLTGFFVTPDAAFHPAPDVAGGAGPFSGAPLTPESPVLAESVAGEEVVWSAEPVDGDEPAIATRDQSSDEGRPDDGGGSPWLWGGLALGGLGLAVGAGGGGGGGSGGSSGGDSVGDTPAPVPAQKTVEGSVVGGPVVEGNGLSVEVFEADGTSRLGEGKVAADGSFSIDVGDHTGVVILRVVDADAGEDYLDEASEEAKDLNAEFSAVQQISDSTATGNTVVVNVNPLTTLAAGVAERAAGGETLTVAQVNDSNGAVANLFGLDDLHGLPVVPTNGGTYDAGDGLSAGETYGAILAAFSGATFNNGGDSQQTIDAVLSGLTVSGSGGAELDGSARSMLLQGAQTTENETGVSLGDAVARAVDTTPPEITSGATADAINEASGSGQVVYSAVAEDATAVTFSLADSGDAEVFDIDPDTGEVTLLEDPDFEIQPGYAFTVVATDAAGNSSQQTVSLDINDVDEEAPAFTSGASAEAIAENSGSGQVVYTATATDEGTVTYSLADSGDVDDFDIGPDTGEVTLLEDPDFETQPGYTFTVVATDEDGNSSQQQVSLDIDNVDEVAPTITSGTTADAIDENSGADQVVYTATADDSGDVSGGVTFSLAPGGDADEFDIDADSGEVTLLEDPDFEAQPSYTFTVVATDAADNSSQRAVSLEINDVDDTPPSVASVALTDADGAENGILNAGDTVTVTVTMSENTIVDADSGTPRIALTIGGSTVFADYVSGSGSTSLNFQYTVQAGDNDSNGIGMPANALQANGGVVTDTTGNAADLAHGSVANDPSFAVDTTAPTLSASTPSDDADDVPVDGDIVLTFSENIQAGSGNIIISDGDDTRTIDVTDGSQVSISGNTVTIDPASDLNDDSTYHVQIEEGAFFDEAGNAYAGISDTTTLDFETADNVDTSIVVFDLVEGVSSDHSGRRFDSDVSYDIYIRVESDDPDLNTDEGGPGTWGTWNGAQNLGSDDRVILVGDGDDVEGPGGVVSQSFNTALGNVLWATPTLSTAAFLQGNGEFFRSTGDTETVDLWNGNWESNPNVDDSFGEVYLTTMPANILTSQGLA